MRNFGRTVIVAGSMLALGLAAGGCSSIRDHRGYVADAMLIDSVQPGIDNRLSVERTLGRPTLISQFGEKEWYYLSMNTKQAAFRRPQTADQTLVRVSFDDAGKVTAVDKTGVEKVVRLDPNGNVTPTLGRDRSFLQDLFGNIGAVGTPGGTAAPQGPGPNGS